MTHLLVLGTNNRNKLEELAPLLDGLPVALKTAGAYGKFAPEETGATLEANAILKAQAAADLSGAWSFADDTGLEVDALDGRPGLYAARYAGPDCSYDDNIDKLLRELQDVPEARRAARFVCVLALCRPGCALLTFRASLAGKILTARRGAHGFGYDPVFFVPEVGKTLAELTREEKNRISHRARAARLLRAELVNLWRREETFTRNGSPPASTR